MVQASDMPISALEKAMHDYDKCSKWQIQHHGDSILRLGGARPIRLWRALQAELVQHRRLPDGLIREPDGHHPGFRQIAL